MSQAQDDLVAAASNPNAELATLHELANNYPGLRPYIAANPRTYPALLEWLGPLGAPAVDAALARRYGPAQPLTSAPADGSTQVLSGEQIGSQSPQAAPQQQSAVETQRQQPVQPEYAQVTQSIQTGQATQYQQPVQAGQPTQAVQTGQATQYQQPIQAGQATQYQQPVQAGQAVQAGQPQYQQPVQPQATQATQASGSSLTREQLGNEIASRLRLKTTVILDAANLIPQDAYTLEDGRPAHDWITLGDDGMWHLDQEAALTDPAGLNSWLNDIWTEQDLSRVTTWLAEKFVVGALETWVPVLTNDPQAPARHAALVVAVLATATTLLVYSLSHTHQRRREKRRRRWY